MAIKDQDGGIVLEDGGIHRGGTVESMAAIKPAFKEDGVIHVGNSSQISDGLAALLIVDGELTAVEAAKAKCWATETAKKVIDHCVQLHGGYGYML